MCKEKKGAPGLVCLEKIVRMSLLGFLEERIRERSCKPKKPVSTMNAGTHLINMLRRCWPAMA